MSISDPTYGDVASFDGGATSVMTLPSPPSTMPTGAIQRTFSYWVKFNSVNTQVIHGQSQTNDYRIQWNAWNPLRLRIISNNDVFEPPSSWTAGAWYHLVTTYNGAEDSCYIDGSFNSSQSRTYTTQDATLMVGGSPALSPQFHLIGSLSDFRVYDYAISATDVSALYADGPNPSPPIPLVLTPRALSIKVTVTPVTGGTGYRLTLQETGSDRVNTVKNNFTDLDQTIRNLVPETEYTVRLFSDMGTGVYDLVDESTVSTLANSASNYDTSEFGSNGRFDLRSLDNTSIALMSNFMNDLFATGDTIDINVQGSSRSKKSKFVNRGSTVSIADSEALVAPFSDDAGSGQTISMTLSDNSTSTVAYDETTNSVTIESTSYSPGESFVLDGKKVIVYDL